MIYRMETSSEFSEARSAIERALNKSEEHGQMHEFAYALRQLKETTGERLEKVTKDIEAVKIIFSDFARDW